MAKQRFYPLWIAMICIIIFVIQILFSEFSDLFVLDSGKAIEFWRFVTSIFLHGNLSHLVLNLFALLLFGLVLEKIIGGSRFLIVYFSSGIIANLIVVNFYSSSLGASGAIYGILGCLAIIRPKMTVFVYNLPMPMFIAAIVWILIGVFGLFVPDNTGHIAHLSGIAIGFLFGLYYLREFREKKETKFKVKIPEEYLQRWEDFYLR